VTIKRNETLYTVKEAAKRLNVTRGRIHQLIMVKRIIPIRVSRELLIPESEILNYERTRRRYTKPVTVARKSKKKAS